MEGVEKEGGADGGKERRVGRRGRNPPPPEERRKERRWKGLERQGRRIEGRRRKWREGGELGEGGGRRKKEECS